MFLPHVLQPLNPVFRAGMSRKEFKQRAPAEGLHDVEMLGCGIGIHGDALRPGIQLFRAPINGYGEPIYFADAASASYSRLREIAIWISIAAIGARISMARSASLVLVQVMQLANPLGHGKLSLQVGSVCRWLRTSLTVHHAPVALARGDPSR